MGTDIHGVFQRKYKDSWVDVPSEYSQERHYQLFAVLAGVRNGYGFAGCITGEEVAPISEPRGLPPDFKLVGYEIHLVPSSEYLEPWRREHYPDDLEVWMGDHSHSWLSGEEMLSWFETAPVVSKTGILDRADYESWDKVQPPENYSGEVWGKTVVVADQNSLESTPEWTHVRCYWTRSLKEELAYFFDEVARLTAEHGEIRFVFGFDS